MSGDISGNAYIYVQEGNAMAVTGGGGDDFIR